MARFDKEAEAKLCKAQIENEEAVTEECDEDSEEDEEMQENPIIEDEKMLLRQEFVTQMYNSFLHGHDKDFDYRFESFGNNLSCEIKVFVYFILVPSTPIQTMMTFKLQKGMKKTCTLTLKHQKWSSAVPALVRYQLTQRRKTNLTLL